MAARTDVMQRSPGRDATQRSDSALPASLALRETSRRMPGAWSQAAKDRLYDRMFPEQPGPLHHGTAALS